jgi:hypothetical protein
MPQVDLKQVLRVNPRNLLLVTVALAAILLVGGASIAIYDSQRHDSVIKQADQFHAQKQYPSEITVLSGYAESNPPASYLYPVAVRLGDLETTQGQFALAAKWYLKAYFMRKPAELHVVLGLAQADALLGDRGNATALYQEAIADTPASDTTHRNLYRDQINYLRRK